MAGWRNEIVAALCLALVGLAGCGQSVRLETTPEHQAAADALGSGRFSDIDDEIFLFAMGAAEDVMDKCQPKVEQSKKMELAPFVTAAVWQGAQGNKYRFGDQLTDLNDAIRDQAKSRGALFAGILAARSLNCAEPASTRIVENAHKLSVEMRGGADGMKSEFIRSCSPQHGAATCSCVALAGLASDTNVFRKTYSRDLIYELMQRSPINGLQIVMGCGLTRY